MDEVPGHDVDYLQWVTDANTIELTKVTAIAGADLDRTEALTTAGGAHALAMSEAAEKLDYTRLLGGVGTENWQLEPCVSAHDRS